MPIVKKSCFTAVAASVLAMTAAMNASTARAAAAPSFVDDGDFNVCVDPTFPPMEFYEKTGDTQPVGVDVDVAKALAEYWGVKVSFSSMDFNGLLPSLSAQRCDAVISGALLTEDRQKTFDGVGYLNTFIVVVGKAGTAPIDDIDGLAGKAIAVQSGTTYYDRIVAINGQLKAKGAAPMDIQQYPKQTDAIQQLQVGRVEGVVSQDTEVAFRELQTPGTFSTIFTVPQDSFQPYAVYMRKSESDTVRVSAAISDLVQAGKLAAIVDKWKLSRNQLDGIQ
ncbi:MAG: transporter substrate-binding domain-containing protein [Rhodospirillaceae bacterium]|nr:MAG: transporter substrate-binding domain-containing protein [Rhodospirillaceae bacterium]